MKTTRMSSRDSALFAVLMRDHHASLPLLPAQWKYEKFLRSQARRGYAGCAYRRAIAMIEGRA